MDEPVKRTVAFGKLSNNKIKCFKVTLGSRSSSVVALNSSWMFVFVLHGNSPSQNS